MLLAQGLYRVVLTGKVSLSVFCLSQKDSRVPLLKDEHPLSFFLPNILHTAAVLNLWVTNPLRVEGPVHRGQLRPAENTDSYITIHSHSKITDTK